MGIYMYILFEKKCIITNDNNDLTRMIVIYI